MAGVSKIPEGYIKPKVGIVYSENDSMSLESKNLAFWLAGSIADSGYATAVLIGYNEEKIFDVAASRRVKYYPCGKNRPQDAPLSDCTFGAIG
jgi:hypothetical protein